MWDWVGLARPATGPRSICARSARLFGETWASEKGWLVSKPSGMESGQLLFSISFAPTRSHFLILSLKNRSALPLSALSRQNQAPLGSPLRTTGSSLSLAPVWSLVFAKTLSASWFLTACWPYWTELPIAIYHRPDAHTACLLKRVATSLFRSNAPHYGQRQFIRWLKRSPALAFGRTNEL